MSVHYFHCTDGRDLVVDRTGRSLRKRDDVERVARGIARDLIAAVPAFDEWDGWAVHVYDERGQVSIVPFDTTAKSPGRVQRATAARPRRLDRAA